MGHDRSRSQRQQTQRRLYIAITIALSENLQYMFPIATTTRNGILLWDLFIQHLFSSTYDDILEASDRLRRWHIDPSKNLKYDLHILSQLIERVNETSQHDIAESQVLAIINKEIMKDPREGLRIIAHNSSINKTSLNDMLNILNGSSYVCSTERVRSTTLLRPLFFTIFLFHATIVIEGEGIGARSVRFPHRSTERVRSTTCPTT